ncbi:MAG: phosphoenolpyruvate carboxykinase (ATP) [Limisphaerales bacterium]|jgi:phosphoenolpyruvate carboxykinase (ATP)
MSYSGIKNPKADLSALGIDHQAHAYWNLPPAELVEHSVAQDLGVLADNGALVIDTGKFKGRSPKDRFIVKDSITENAVDWNAINLPFDSEAFDRLYDKVVAYLSPKALYVRDSYACADPKHRLDIRVVNEFPWQNLFCYNLFLRPTTEETRLADPEWVIIAAPSFKADPEVDKTRSSNFAVVNFTRKIILIGGTGYTGEMKKGIFSVLNFTLPHQHGVLSMHCSANVGNDGDTAIFFGLSGTGKTTLSADPERQLIGDDEHGWTDSTVFNFEGGCYAKCIDLTAEKEPQIFKAIKFGSLVENTLFHEGTRSINYEEKSKTENTRVGYPIDYIDNIVVPSVGNTPEHIFFLTCDAFGVLPPVSRLTTGQAMYHFISGYTAKVAGTEAGITEPVTAFSACFGAPFLPLHPTKYAEMLGAKMENSNVKVWLINTGWSGGPYGVGSRMKLRYTRAMITAAMRGELDNVEFEEHPVFGLAMPKTCPNVPEEVLNPINTWSNKEEYTAQANDLATKFNDNFVQYADKANAEILGAAPVAVS